MGWLGIFRKKEDSVKAEPKKILFRMFLLMDEADIMDAVQHVKLGSTIAFFKVKNKDLTKSALVSLKTACHSVNGEIVGLPDGWFVAAPSSVEIVKKSADAGKQVAQTMIERERQNADTMIQRERQAKDANESMDDRIIVVDEIDTL